MAEGTGRTLKPSKFTVKPMDESRVYPNTAPDDYGQVNTPDKDRSRMGGSANHATESHYRADTDASQGALHHTLGPGRNQSAPGNHQHDGMTSQKIGPFEANPSFNPALPIGPTNLQFRPAWTCPNTTAGIRELLHNFLEFRDV